MSLAQGGLTQGGGLGNPGAGNQNPFDSLMGVSTTGGSGGGVNNPFGDMMLPEAGTGTNDFGMLGGMTDGAAQQDLLGDIGFAVQDEMMGLGSWQQDLTSGVSGMPSLQAQSAETPIMTQTMGATIDPVGDLDDPAATEETPVTPAGAAPAGPGPGDPTSTPPNEPEIDDDKVRDQLRMNIFSMLMAMFANNNNSFGPFGSRTWHGTPGTPGYHSITQYNPVLAAGMDYQQNAQRAAMWHAMNNMMTNPEFSSPFRLNLDEYGMGQPLDPNGQNPYTQGAFDKAMMMMQPRFDEEHSRALSQLANQGISRQSRAGREAMDELSRQQGYQTDMAINTAMQQGRQAQAQGFQQLMAARGQAGTEQMSEHQQNWSNLMNQMNMGMVYQQPGQMSGAQGNIPSPNLLGYGQGQDQLSLMRDANSNNQWWNLIMGGLGLASLGSGNGWFG